jgi:hypothetical protein
MSERGEQSLVQQLVTQPAVEALDEGVLRRLAWRDVRPSDLGVLLLFEHRVRGPLGAVVADYQYRFAAPGDIGVERDRPARLTARCRQPA